MCDKVWMEEMTEVRKVGVTLTSTVGDPRGKDRNSRLGHQYGVTVA